MRGVVARVALRMCTCHCGACPGVTLCAVVCVSALCVYGGGRKCAAHAWVGAHVVRSACLRPRVWGCMGVYAPACACIQVYMCMRGMCVCGVLYGVYMCADACVYASVLCVCGV